MEKIETKIRQIVYKAKKDYFTLNNVTLFIALVFCASWVWASITTMSRNWELEQKLQEKTLQGEKLKLEVASLELTQEYYKTSEYQELMARAKLNKMAEGEKMVILPNNSDKAKNKYAEQKTEVKKQKSTSGISAKN